jgi:hypothetical protein
MRLSRCCGVMVILVLGFGCARQQPETAQVFRPDPVVTPTSDRPTPRVYSTDPGAGEAARPPAPSVSATDLAIAEELSQLLKADSGLAAVTGEVLATVHQGVVTLRGNVPTGNVRDELYERVSKLPGVVQVQDHLAVNTR